MNWIPLLENRRKRQAISGACMPPVWAERLPDLDHLLYRAYPRACAIAEAGWSPMSVRSWENFRRKLADHRQFILKRFNYDMKRTQGNEPAFRWENNK